MAKKIALKPAGKSTKKLSPLARDILEGLEEYASYKRGEKSGIKTYVFPKVPESVDVKSIRVKLGMTQEQFTSFGFSLSAIRHWEAHRRTPEGSARVLLNVIDRNPKIVLDVFHY
ncbi:MAG: transcriptional regulator [Pseudomonadota bacterium]